MVGAERVSGPPAYAPALNERVRAELVAQSMHEVVHTVPVLLVALAVVAALGLQAGRTAGTVGMLAIGFVVAVWRRVLHRRFQGLPQGEEVDAAQRALRHNAQLTGAMWCVGTLTVFPYLEREAAATYTGMVCGSVGLALFSFGLAARAYEWLVALQTGAFVLGSVIAGLDRTWPMALLMALFGPGMIRGARSLRELAAHALRRRHELDELNRRLDDARRTAEAANEAKDTFLANVSHEIRTPLTAIIGFSQELPEADEATRSADLRSIHRAGRHLLGLVDDLLDLARMDAGRLSFERRPTDLHELLQEVADILRPRARQRGLSLDVSWDEALPVRVCTDALRLRQVLLNLAGNAVKFTERGGVRVFARRDGDEIRVEVVDTGIGIDPKALPRLFTPFAQADDSIARRFGGSGLGLALSGRLAEGLGGRLEVQSTPEVGSRFTLRLPLDDADRMAARGAAAARPAAAAEAAPAQGAVHGHVLLVEDHPDNQRLLQRLAQRLGAQVTIAGTGGLGLAHALADDPDLVLLDLQLPDLDGLEVLELMRDGGRRGPVIVMSAHGERERGAEAEAAGADAFLGKPVDRLRFEQALRGALSPRRGPAGGGDAPLRSRLLDEDASLQDLVAHFVARLPALVDGLRAAREEGRTDELARRLHDLCALGGQYGYPQVTAFARALSACDDAALSQRLFDRFLDLCERIVRDARTSSPVP